MKKWIPDTAQELKTAEALHKVCPTCLAPSQVNTANTSEDRV